MCIHKIRNAARNFKPCHKNIIFYKCTLCMAHLGLMHADPVDFHLPGCVKQVEICFSRHLPTTVHTHSHQFTSASN